MTLKEGIAKIIPTLNFKFPYSADEYAKHLYFENYHKHTDFSNTSTPDSAESIQAYADRANEFGAKCLFSGEHGSQGNQFLVYKTAEASHLKYVHSSEVYWVKDRLKEYPEIDKDTGEYKKDKDGNIRMSKDRTNCHMIIVAKNAEGRKDLNYILSVANEDGYYYKPRIDLDLLFQIPKDNVIVTSACLVGWNYEDAEDIWLKIHDHFGKNFYLEVQYHNTEKQRKLNQKIINLSTKYNIQIICGLDSHYVVDENSIKRDQILKYKNINYPDEDGWYMDYPDVKTIIKRFKEQGVLNNSQVLRAIMNTNVFITECEEIVFDRHFKIPTIYPNLSEEEKIKLYKDLLNHAYNQEKHKSIEKIKGIRYEAEQVIDSHVVDYFLTSSKIIEEATKHYGGVLTTTSRGSAASFITNKLLGLTTVDRYMSEIPIYPERFLTKDRVLSGSMPD